MPELLFADPFDWFQRWFDEALRSGLKEPTAMTLATVSEDGQPQARIVLLKHHDRKGFVFYTNRQSRKGVDLGHHPRGGLNFYWADLDRQVRIDGLVEPVSDEEADDYFATRHRESQIGAWTSLQSAPLSSRAALIERIAEIEARYQGQPVPRPPHWSGFRVVPRRMEFWAAGDFRLHDRWEFTRDDEDQPWSSQRLFP